MSVYSRKEHISAIGGLKCTSNIIQVVTTIIATITISIIKNITNITMNPQTLQFMNRDMVGIVMSMAE
jgi:hypothetical protein